MAPSDHELIRNTIAQWPIIMDQKRPHLLSKAFFPDAIFRYPPPIGTICGIVALAEMIQSLNDVTTYHSLGTQIIDLTSLNTATATTYCIGVHVGRRGRVGESMTILGYYEDDLRKSETAGEGEDDHNVWRIVERRVHHHIPATGGQTFPALA